MDLIRMKNVRKVYKNGTTAIHNLDLSIQKGEFVFIIGATGCGKSTLIKMLYREEKPTAGSITVGGLPVAKMHNRSVYKLRRKLGVVFQDFKLLPKLTVYENIAFALEVFGLPRREIHAKVMKVLDLVGLKNKAKQYPRHLSGGEQQRVAIARAIAKNPKLLLCDEPTGALDSKTGKMIIDLLYKTCKEMKMTTVLITHNADIAKIADKVITIANGKVESIETKDMIKKEKVKKEEPKTKKTKPKSKKKKKTN